MDRVADESASVPSPVLSDCGAVGGLRGAGVERVQLVGHRRDRRRVDGRSVPAEPGEERGGVAGRPPRRARVR